MSSSDELRAALAGLAMQGILSNANTSPQFPVAQLAKTAVWMADAVLAELEKDGSEPTSDYVNQD
jgi:hypothetical protein